MATGVSSRSRRSDYFSGTPKCVPSYPLPVNPGVIAVHSAQISSKPTPGPVPGTKDSNSRLPPPPSQDTRLYARHFPSLPEPSNQETSDEYETSANSEERWQQQEQHRTASYSNPMYLPGTAYNDCPQYVYQNNQRICPDRYQQIRPIISDEENRPTGYHPDISGYYHFTSDGTYLVMPSDFPPRESPLYSTNVIPYPIQQPSYPTRSNPIPSDSSGLPTPEGETIQNDCIIQTIKVRAVISGWKAGTIIGRQGQVISQLRTESHCKITISDDPTSPDRVLTVMGHANSVADVLRRVCFMIGASASSYNRDGRRADDNKQTSDHTYTADSTDLTPEDLSAPVNFTLAVPSPMCGCLIGRAGVQIKNFRQIYGVSFSVSSHPILESLDRPVNISGPPENVANCLEEVCRLFASAPVPVRKPRIEYPPEHLAEQGGFRSNWRRNLSDADVHHHGGSEGGSVSGEYQRSEEAAQKRRKRQDESSPVVDGEILGNAIEECSFELNTGETEVHLLVPNDIVGCIIGKGGKTISEIRSTSGALISITESAFPPPMPANATSSSYPSTVRRDVSGKERGLRSRDRVICIRGRSKNIRTARYLMGSSILNAQRGMNQSDIQ